MSRLFNDGINIKGKIKTIALDMDGTLLDSNNKILSKTKSALLKLQEEGIHIILVSGRPIKSMLEYAKELKLEEYEGIIVSNNGALGYDVKKHENIFQSTLDHELAVEILTMLEAKDILVLIEDGTYMLVEDAFAGMFDTGADHMGLINIIEYEKNLGGFLLKEAKPLKDFIDFPLYKILTVVDQDKIGSEMEEFKTKFADRVHIAQSSPYFMEFMSSGVNKRYGLEKLGIPAEGLLAFGDSMNDKEMLEYAEYSVAMDNATDEIKSITTFTTKGRDEEGIYEALKALGLLD